MIRSRPDVWPKLVGLARFSFRVRRLLDETITASEPGRTSPMASHIAMDGFSRNSTRSSGRMPRAPIDSFSRPPAASPEMSRPLSPSKDSRGR